MNFPKVSEIVLGAILTLFIGLYFRLSNQLDELTKTNIAVAENLHHITKSVDKNTIEIERLKATMYEQKEQLRDEINQLRLDCAKWFKSIEKNFNKQK